MTIKVLSAFAFTLFISTLFGCASNPKSEHSVESKHIGFVVMAMAAYDDHYKDDLEPIWINKTKDNNRFFGFNKGDSISTPMTTVLFAENEIVHKALLSFDRPSGYLVEKIEKNKSIDPKKQTSIYYSFSIKDNRISFTFSESESIAAENQFNTTDTFVRGTVSVTMDYPLRGDILRVPLSLFLPSVECDDSQESSCYLFISPHELNPA